MNKMGFILNRLTFGIVCKLRILLYKALSNKAVEGPLIAIQPIQVMGEGRVIVSNNVRIGYFPSPHFFSSYTYLESRSRSSIILIGENTRINNGFVAVADKSCITIGDNCLIGTHVEIYDSDFHALRVSDRREGKQSQAKEVTIGKDVFIGSNVKVLKGVTIGEGAVIANGSIVTGSIPPHVVAGGNPARVIMDL